MNMTLPHLELIYCSVGSLISPLLGCFPNKTDELNHSFISPLLVQYIIASENLEEQFLEWWRLLLSIIL